MAFNFNSITQALSSPSRPASGVDFSGKSLKLDTAQDAQPIVEAINKCPDLQFLNLTGNTLGVEAAAAIAKALETHPEFKVAQFSDMFTGRMKTEIPPALKALGEGIMTAGARLRVLELSDNAFGPIGVEGLASMLKSDSCSQLQELRLNNNGLGITGGKLLAQALSKNVRQLKVFVAGRNRLENEGAKALAEVFQNMGSLEEVSMPQNGIYHVGISALSRAFSRNPKLSTLNLNDNTIGPKGAEAISGILPNLKNLKSINFGDCLLKSKGALSLAKAFKDGSMQLESLDLSHNEIGRDACMEVVNSVTDNSENAKKLNKVVLAGNSLGGASNKKVMKDKLGASAELSDGEGSDNEYVSDDDEDEDGSDDDEDEENEDEGDDDNSDMNLEKTIAHAIDITSEEILDTSGVEEIDTDAGRFLREPSLNNLLKLGSKADEVIDVHLQAIKDPADLIQAYVDATFCVSGLASQSGTANTIACRLFPTLLMRAGQQHAAAWLLANTMLRGLGLIKSENKDYKIRWLIPGCYSVLGTVIDEPFFPPALRDTLKFFIKSKLDCMPQETAAVVKKYSTLCS